MARVLLVDDDIDALEIRKLIFERRGHRVTIAANAEIARVQFQSASPESVILDLRIPHLEDGLALIREFRSAAPELDIIVLTGDSAVFVTSPENALVNAVLAKPVRSEVLLNAISAPA